MARELRPGAAFALVTSRYYRGVPAGSVGAALRHLTDMLSDAGWPMDARTANLIYLFGRVAQCTPEARVEIEAQAAVLSGRAAEFTRTILRAAVDPAFPDVLTQSISGPGDLDQLWAEFFVTGDSAPVLRIVRTLDEPDGIRRLLSAWLQERSWFGGAKRTQQADALRKAGLSVDLGTKVVVTEGDLDCLCYSLAARKVPIFPLLPFRVPEQDLLNLAVKGAALWSLRLNGNDHPLVRTVCETEHARPGGAARSELLNPLAAREPFAL